jgi:hypothetical protein
MKESAHDQRISPTRLLEMPSDRFGAFEASRTPASSSRALHREEGLVVGVLAEAWTATHPLRPIVGPSRLRSVQ